MPIAISALSTPRPWPTMLVVSTTVSSRCTTRTRSVPGGYHPTEHYANPWVSISTYISIYVYIYTCIYVYMYKYIYIDLHVFICFFLYFDLFRYSYFRLPQIEKKEKEYELSLLFSFSKNQKIRKEKPKNKHTYKPTFLNSRIIL